MSTEMEGEIMELQELRYSDLILLSSDDKAEENQRLESLARMVMETLGPNGPGLLAITGVPRTSSLRRSLLPLSRNLALLNNEDRKKLLKEHDLGSDVPLKNLDRIVSSFAKKLKYDERFESSSCRTNQPRVITGEDYIEVDQMGFKNLGYIFNELGYSMMEVGLRLAQICDKSIGGHDLEQSLLESGTVKGRLIHYHSAIDNHIIKEAANRSIKTGPRNKHQIRTSEETGSGTESMLWQQWHYDYGIFTVLTVPMFILSSENESNNLCMPYEQESCSPSGHTYLQIFDPNKDRVFMVKAPPESLIVQVGEAADILSKGKLRATLHSVCRPPIPKNLSRETFVVFLQPAWSKKLYLSDYPLKQLDSNDKSCRMCTEDEPRGEQESERLIQKIRNIVPSLSSRIKDGMTFADFSRETTNQYYGSNGLQSNR